MNKRVYVDTSYYLSILLRERNWRAQQKQLERCEMCTSTLLFLEAERTLVHLSRMGHLGMPDYERAVAALRANPDIFIVRDLTMDLCLSGEFPVVRTPRSLDLIHLRTAKWFQQNGGIEKFFSLDSTLLSAAREVNLPI